VREQDTIELDLREIFSILLKRIWIIIAASVIGFASAYVISKFIISPLYTSSVSLYVNNTNDAQVTNAVNINDINASQKLVNTYIVILQDDEVLTDLLNELLDIYGSDLLSSYFSGLFGGNASVETRSLRDVITMSAVNNTEVLRVEAETKNAELSATICTLMTQIAPDTLMRVVKAGSVEVIGKAKPADEPSSPRVLLNSLIGLIAGMAFAVIGVMLVHVLDNTVKDEEGLKKRFNIPVLGEIPDFNTHHKGGYTHYGR
jgi:capsular polysaccharide biosynthesis protein